MHLVTFQSAGQSRIGILDPSSSEINDLSQSAPDLPEKMMAFIAMGNAGLVEARRAIKNGKGRIPISSVRMLAPIPNPRRNIFCVGKNYREHARELHSTNVLNENSGNVIPEAPIFFTKATSSIIGPDEPIPGWLDPESSTDYEGELGVIIGTGGRGITRAEAMRHVYGYTIINDVTSRGLQRRHGQWFLGKSLDGYCPMGPAIVTVDEVTDIGASRLQTHVNGELRQEARISDLIFDIPTLIEYLSRSMTLQSGDIIATGTPAGVGAGFKPPKYLKKGDVVVVFIDRIGRLENAVA
jgi:2-keto-4-pentenoate hydratase/2-oxohepta-3-ene-1,7-dioic acid hydratase in catechol pathway